MEQNLAAASKLGELLCKESTQLFGAQILQELSSTRKQRSNVFDQVNARNGLLQAKLPLSESLNKNLSELTSLLERGIDLLAPSSEYDVNSIEESLNQCKVSYLILSLHWRLIL